MKLANCVVGLLVKVKDQEHTGFFNRCRGKKGIIVRVNNQSGVRLTVCVKFHDGTIDWGSHHGIKKVKGA